MIFTDCVVPISKLNLGTEVEESQFTSDFPSSLLDSHINSEGSIVPLLRDQPLRSPSSSEPSYTASYHDGDSSLTQIAIESSSYPGGMHTDAAVQYILNERYTLRNPRQALSTERLNELPHLAMPETLRVRRNSTSESRVRRHSAAPFRLDSHVRLRRRSHDIRDEQVDLLERLHGAATRRRSLSSPFQTTARYQGLNRKS